MGLFKLAFISGLSAAIIRASEDDTDVLTSEQLRRMHDKFDGNGDGKASLEEVLKFAAGVREEMWKKELQTILQDMDHDKDGKLDADEYRMWSIEWEQDAGTWEVEKNKFQAADANRDDVVDQDELHSLLHPETNNAVLRVMAAAFIERKDADGDGKLSLEEFGERELMDDQRPMSPEEEAEFKEHDLDRSGSLDIKEVAKWEANQLKTGHLLPDHLVHAEESMRLLFEAADKDGDKHVTAAELEAARAEIDDDAQYHLLEWAGHHEL